MKVFVTGATGVIGRRLVPLLHAAAHEVTALARRPSARAQLEATGVTTADVDLLDRRAVDAAVAGQDAVVNLATHIPRSSARTLLPWAWRENDRLRRDASALLVDACMAAGTARFVQESFAPVYPDCGDRWIDESVRIRPVGHSRSVEDAEAATTRFAASGRVGIVLRFGAFYGRDAFQTTDLVRWVGRGWAPLPGPAGAYVSSVSHADAASAAAVALGLPSGVYNVVDDEPVTHREYVDALAEALHVAAPRLPPQWLTPIFGSVGRLAARSLRISNTKLRSESEWAPKYPSVREGWVDVVRAPHRHWRFAPNASMG